jgi:hypothetical protein
MGGGNPGQLTLVPIIQILCHRRRCNAKDWCNRNSFKHTLQIAKLTSSRSFATEWSDGCLGSCLGLLRW